VQGDDGDVHPPHPQTGQFGDPRAQVPAQCLPPRRQASAVADFRRLLDRLPPHVAVVATLPRRNRAALAINALIEEAAARGTVGVADMRGRRIRSLIGTLAEDHFHPNERGYSGIAESFARGIAQANRLPLSGAGDHPVHE
jgi:lysophospholipase L1-like esterase